MPSQPTPALEQQIAAFIRAGGFPHVAAEAAGVAARTFRRWLRCSNKPESEPCYRTFAAAIRQAKAQARLRAEIAALEGKPLDWLKYGPGKETARNPGWTATVRAAVRSDGGNAQALENAACQALVAELMEMLEVFPEVRAAVATRMDRPKSSRRGRFANSG
jgi:hypothetical protein